MDLLKRLVSEPGTESPESYARRVRRLAALYVLLHLTSIAGVVLLAWHGKLFVTLSQRSNVETLVIAFFLVLFVYLASLSLRGALGASRIAAHAFRARISGDRGAAERHKTAVLGRRRGDGPVVAVNSILEREASPGRPFELRVADEFGGMGMLRVDGARIHHLPEHRDGSVNLLAFFVQQVADLLRKRDASIELDVVEWGTLDDDGTKKWIALTQFAQNLGKQLGAPLWPLLRLTDADCGELERKLAAVVPALREEAFLPEWEYTADHKLPVIPEPLGLISLGRSEKRADPMTAIGCATLVVCATVLVIIVFILAPPWVPG